MHKKILVPLTISLLTFSTAAIFADDTVTIRGNNGNTYEVIEDTYINLSDEALYNNINGEQPVGIIGEHEFPTLEYEGTIYYFISDEFQEYSHTELEDFIKQTKSISSYAAANLSSKKAANNVTVSWGPYTTDAVAALLWTPKVSANTPAVINCTGANLTDKSVNLSSSSPTCYIFSNYNPDEHTLSVKNTGAGTVTVSGTFDIQY